MNVPSVPDLLDEFRLDWSVRLGDDQARLRTHPAARGRLIALLSEFLVGKGFRLEERVTQELLRSMVDQIGGWGPIESFIRDQRITEVIVNGPNQIYIERDGHLHRVEACFEDADALLDLIQRYIAPLGRRLDPSRPFVDGRLPDGSRVHAIIAPVARSGPYLNIRKFRQLIFQPDELIELGSWTPEVRDLLASALERQKNILISGGTGTGKTSILNTLCLMLADTTERVVSMEDAAELRLPVANWAALEARSANVEGEGAITLRDLLKSALRMRPDRLIVGEVRGVEAFDLLQALNTGHRGSLSTIHANGSGEALERLADLALLAHEGLSFLAVARQVGAAIDLVVHLERGKDGVRRVTCITDVERDERGWQLNDVWQREKG